MVKKTSEDMIKNSSLTIETAKLSLSLAIEKIAEFPEDAE
jgi:hypothetical protein|tara:strand:+ start:899 stop:1018 length:120 start_codon:yes stop_codon:yes gene_type:complete